MNDNEQVVHRVLAAVEAGDVEGFGRLFEWQISAAWRVADQTRILPESRVRVLTVGLGNLDRLTAGDPDDVWEAARYLFGELEGATGVRPAPPDVRDAFLAHIQVPSHIVDGPTPEQLERLAEFRDRAALVRDVYIISRTDRDDLVVGVTPEGKLVLPPAPD